MFSQLPNSQKEMTITGGLMNNKLVYAAGVFDIIHEGHIKYLESSKRYGDILVVGLLEDDAVVRYKFKKPILNIHERWKVLEAIRCVDYVVRQDDTDPTNTLTRIKNEHGWIFDFLCRGDDYKGEPPGSEFIKRYGGKVIKIPYSYNISSTDIKNRVINESRSNS